MNFLLALAANTFFFLGFQALFPTLPLYIVNHLNGTPTDNGLVTFVFAATAVLARPLLGGLTDRWGRKPLMLIGALIFVVAPLCYALSRSLALLLIARALQGVGIAAFTTAYQALIVDLAPLDRRGQSLGMSANAMALAMALGPLGGDAVMTRLGFTPLFILCALSAAVCLLLVALIRPPQLQSAPLSLIGGLRHVLKQRRLHIGLFGMSLMGLVFGAFITFIPLFVQQGELGASGAFFTIYALALLTVQAGAGRLSDRIGRTNVAAPALLAIGICIAALARAQTIWMAWGMVFLYGLAAGATRVALDGMIADSVLPPQRATAVALQFTSYDLWIGLGGMLMGPLAETVGYAGMYAIAGAAVIAGAIPFTLLARARQ